MATQPESTVTPPAANPPAATGTAANGKAADAPKTVLEDMANRRVFSATKDETGAVTQTAVQAASEYLNASAQTFTDFGSYPLAAPGIDAEGNFDPAIYGDDSDVMVALLRHKSKVKCIVVAPVPTLDSLLSDAPGIDWATKILHKEMNHVAVRALREADDVSTVVDQMPTNRMGYIESNRGDGGIMEAFSELHKPVNATLAAKFPVWAKARLIKSEMKKAMESKGYAAEFYPALEDYKGQSLLVIALGLAVATAKRKGLDPTIFERWLATRDQKVYTPGEAEEQDEDEFDVEALTESLLSDAKPATEDEAGEPTDANTTPDAPPVVAAEVADSTAQTETPTA